jgi:carbonic anhydrase/acetyltransferase-like protein (isoleucine patch superfamily)
MKLCVPLDSIRIAKANFKLHHRNRAPLSFPERQPKSRTARLFTLSRISPARISARAIRSDRSRGCGTRLGAGARISNFVEVRQAVVEAGAKAKQLSCIGDAFVDAGTITGNDDGSAKNRSTIRKDAFIGSNSALVAPTGIGEGAYVGPGAVISANVPADALAVARGRQVIKESWATRLRQLKSLGKKKSPPHE